MLILGGSMKNLVKTLLTFITYFSLYILINNVFKTNETIINSFISDILFLIFIIIMYFNDIKDDFNNLRKESIKKTIKIILKNVLFIFLLNIVMGIVTQIFIPNANNIDQNATQIVNLFDISLIYTLFKTLFFASIAEELMFRKSINKIINNKVIFVVVSSLIYSIINIMYTDFSSDFVLFDFLSYFLLSIILSVAYVRNNNNIFYIIGMKFIYNLIPTIILLSGVLI